MKIRSVTYGNGFTVRNEDDAFNRVTGILYGEETESRYTFRYNAKNQAAWMKDTQLNRITETEYDLSDRPCRIRITQSFTHCDATNCTIHNTGIIQRIITLKDFYGITTIEVE